MFVDNVEIKVRAGNGGNGLASFRREKFLPFGGPDGGDGGKGGDIYLVADADMQDLAAYKHRLIFKAGNGERGGTNKKHGINGVDLLIKVPLGTAAYVKKDGEEQLVADLQGKGKKLQVAKGGKGGKGNVHYATATRKAPEIFQPGEEGEQFDITLRMKLITDVCIVGYPNSGKSTLLSAVSAARPQVADYPFTTKYPVLGVVDDGVQKYIWAELPAIVKGSGQGKGFGNSFLIHAERAAVLVYLLDAGSSGIAEEFVRLKEEIKAFDLKLAEKSSIIAINKTDLIEEAVELAAIKEKLEETGLPVYAISAALNTGVSELIPAVHKIVSEHKKRSIVEMGPEMVFRPRPVDLRD
ncbi:MAG: GTPase ObgE [Chloroflexi bacterium]|nr:GTPase ObgE [Chloroflexota bacterium]